MQPASISEIRKELKHKSQGELVEICLRLGRFKKDNKELLSYLLFDSRDEQEYITMIKYEIDDLIDELNHRHVYYIKKGLMKIQRSLNKYIRYSGNKQTEVEILVYFLQAIKRAGISVHTNSVISNMYTRIRNRIEKALNKLHEDIQADFIAEVEAL